MRVMVGPEKLKRPDDAPDPDPNVTDTSEAVPEPDAETQKMALEVSHDTDEHLVLPTDTLAVGSMLPKL